MLINKNRFVPVETAKSLLSKYFDIIESNMHEIIFLEVNKQEKNWKFDTEMVFLSLAKHESILKHPCVKTKCATFGFSQIFK